MAWICKERDMEAGARNYREENVEMQREGERIPMTDKEKKLLPMAAQTQACLVLHGQLAQH